MRERENLSKPATGQLMSSYRLCVQPGTKQNGGPVKECV